MDAEERGIPPSFRTKLKTLLEDVSDDPEMLAFLKDALSLTRLKWASAHVKCKHCNKESRTRVQVDAPDYAGYLKVLSALSDQVYGRPRVEEPKETASDEVNEATLAAIREVVRAELGAAS